MPNSDLPVWQLHGAILRSLSACNRLVLVAATGSGKTTQVPQMLLDAGIGGGRKIVVLQPRRVAARTVAARVAWERNSKLGGEVGYQIRFEDRTSLGTRICFVTEGILLRWLQDDRDLSEVGAVLFDEFHERNLLSDVALALVKRIQAERRPDLQILVMSATLEASPVAKYLGDAPILESDGRTFPVDIRWADYLDNRPMVEQGADAVERIIRSGDPGDILVFMPGMGEIQSTINAIHSSKLGERVNLIPLHGDLPPQDQDRAFQPSDLRKVVVATNVAETSVTIDGIRHVVDSGVARVARYDADRGIQTLFIEDISRASADQRAGRAGRTAPGTCWRLWTESGHLNRPAKNTPEIQRADLAEVVLLLHSLGISKAAQFDWLDKPDLAAVERAEKLLHTLGAIDLATERLTEVGARMLRLPMHPRFSRMLVEASRRGCVPGAAQCAALVSGRDLLMRPGRDDTYMKEARELFEASHLSDFYTLMRAQQFAKKSGFSVETCRRYGIHAQTARQIEDTFQQVMQVADRERLLRDDDETVASDDALLRCILAGFVDQVAKRRDTGTLDCDLTEGRTGTLVRESVVQSPLFVAASIREVAGRTGNMTLLGQATTIEPKWLEEMFPQHLTARVEHLYDRTHKRVAAVKLVRFLDLVIAHEHQRETDPAAAGRCLADAFARGWIELPNLNHEVRQFIGRVRLMRHTSPDLEFPEFDAAAIQRCVANALNGCTLVREAIAADLLPAFRRHLPDGQLAWLDELAPLSVATADGRKLKLQYATGEEPGEPPETQVKLVDMMSLTEHPRIAEGRVPVRLWLHTPDGKRLDSTTDWPGWKERTYPKMRPGLKAKFPSLLWP